MYRAGIWNFVKGLSYGVAHSTMAYGLKVIYCVFDIKMTYLKIEFDMKSVL